MTTVAFTTDEPILRVLLRRDAPAIIERISVAEIDLEYQKDPNFLIAVVSGLQSHFYYEAIYPEQGFRGYYFTSDPGQVHAQLLSLSLAS